MDGGRGGNLVPHGRRRLRFHTDREKLNRTALATAWKIQSGCRIRNITTDDNRGQNEDYEYQGIRSISGKDILKDRELMDGAEFQELEPVANK